MRRIDAFKRSTLALVVTSSVFAVIVIVEWFNAVQLEDFDSPAVEASEAAIPEFSGSMYLPPSLDELDEMLERPLFFSDRRMPAPPELVAVAAAPPTPLRLKLEGVAITTESRVAVLRNLDNNQLVQLAEGMDHESWTLDSVTADGARFSRGQQISELVLDPQAGRKSR